MGEEVKHLGDITKIDGAAISVVDVITGGSHCQSVAVVTDDGIGKYIPGPGCPKQNTAEKPPIGPKPYYVWISERIRELAAAIDENAARSYNHVKVWALEIAMLKDMEKTLDEARKEDFEVEEKKGMQG